MRQRGRAGGWALIVVLAMAGCATSQKTETQTGEHSAVDYWPLALGHAWTYRIKHGGAVQENQVKIVEENAEGFFVDSQGARMKHHAAGVFDGDRYLLKDPLTVGTKWMAVPSANALERFEIIGVGFTSTVPAGVFENCVRVQAVNRINDSQSFIGEWTYAPGVGLIQFSSRHETKGKDPQPQTEMVLLRFDQGVAS